MLDNAVYIDGYNIICDDYNLYRGGLMIYILNSSLKVEPVNYTMPNNSTTGSDNKTCFRKPKAWLILCKNLTY